MKDFFQKKFNNNEISYQNEEFETFVEYNKEKPYYDDLSIVYDVCDVFNYPLLYSVYMLFADPKNNYP